MNRLRSHVVMDYLVAVLSVAVAAVITHIIWPQAAVPNDTFLIAAVMIAAFRGGLGPALLATILASLVLIVVVSPWRFEFALGPDNQMSVVLFLLISVLAGTLHAITRQAAAAALRARQAAEAANAAKGRFLAMVSHELRTPLSPIVLMTQLLESDERLAADVREDLAVVRHNAETLARLVDDLLDAVRTGTGKLTLQPQMLGAHGLIREVVDICREEIRHKTLGLRVDLSADADELMVDPVRLKQVIWNLVRNAVKFTPEGGAITLQTYNVAHERLAIEVIDTGIGIAGPRRSELFTAFEQGGERITMQYGGLGLGLTIAKLLTEAQGGSIEIESAGERQGTTVRLLFPLSVGNEGQGFVLGADSRVAVRAAAVSI